MYKKGEPSKQKGIPSKPRWYEYENRMNQIRREKNLTLEGLGRMVGKSYRVIESVELGYQSIFKINGSVKDFVVKISEIMGVSLEDIFPRDICSLLRPLELTEYQINEILCAKPEESLMNEAMSNYMKLIISGLPPRWRTVLILRFGLFGERGHTLDEVGEIFNLTRESIRVLEHRGLRWLRHPNRSVDLKRTRCLVDDLRTNR